MKHCTFTGPRGTGSYSRRVARIFLSGDWLDRPLSAAATPTPPSFGTCLRPVLDAALTGKAVAP